MKNIEEIKEEIIEDFKLFSSWEQRYEYLIDMGKNLDKLEEKHKIDENLIKGCQSQVWMIAEFKEDRLFFKADSDAIIPRGIVSLLTEIYSGQKIQNILSSNEDFLKEISLTEFLSPTRANGLLSMIKQIKTYCLAFCLKNNGK